MTAAAGCLFIRLWKSTRQGDEGMTHSEGIHVRLVEQLSEIRSLAQEWIELCDKSSSCNPFNGPDWSVPWYEMFANGRVRPWLLELRDGECLVGVVPLSRRFRVIGVPVIKPAGAGSPWIGPYEIPGPVSLPEYERRVAREAVSFICAHSGEWAWTILSVADMVDWFEPAWLSDDRFKVMLDSVVPTVVLRLPEGAERYRPGRNLRESVRRARNRLNRDFDATWHVNRVIEPESVARSLEVLMRLHGARASRRDKSAIHRDVLASRAVRRIVELATESMATRGLVSIYELIVGKDVFATQLVLHTKRSTHFSVSGQTPEAWPYSSITYLSWEAVLDAQAAGHTLIDFSAGPTEAKMRWSHEVKVHPSFVIVGPSLGSRSAFVVRQSFRGLSQFREALGANRRVDS